ncbi:MAG TPA: hypothetical protein VGO71_20010 [Baekduia sp.]|nr:hypothetical protein [Baekduia sp.]
MYDVLLDADGRSNLAVAIAEPGRPARPAVTNLLSPLGVATRSPEELARAIEEIAVHFAGVDFGIVTVDHRRAQGQRVVLGLAVSPEVAFAVGGDGGDRTLISQAVSVQDTLDALVEAIGFRLPSEKELDAAPDDDLDTDQEPGPATATTVPVISALVEVFDGAPASTVPRSVAIQRLGVFAAEPDAILDALVGDGILQETAEGFVVGPAVAAAPGMAQAATGDRLELVRFRLPDAPGADLTEVGRLTFLGPAGDRHALLRSGDDATVARLELGELVLLLATFVAGRMQPAVLPAVDQLPRQRPAATAAPEPFTVEQLATPGEEPLLCALTAPGVIVEVVADRLAPPDRVGVSIGRDAAAAWTWSGHAGTVEGFDGTLPAMAATLAGAIARTPALSAAGVIDCECRWRDAREQVAGTTVTVDLEALGSSDLAGALLTQLDSVDWPAGVV